MNAKNFFLDQFNGEPSWPELESFVKSGATESQIVEFKSEDHPTGDKGNAEFAKDVAALANSEGGVILFGIAEGEKDGFAVIDPILIDQRLDARLRQLIFSRVSPPISFSSWWLVLESDAAKGVFVLHIPRSPYAPHAVANSNTLMFPVRRGTITTFLAEPDLARAYESRIMSGESRERKILHLEKTVKLALPEGNCWLILTLVPDNPGPTRMDEKKFNRIRMKHLQKDVGLGWWRCSWSHVFAGLSKARLYSGYEQNEGWPSYAFAELYADGSGSFAGFVPEVATATDVSANSDVIALNDEQFAEWILGGLQTLTSHARDMGAGFSFLLRTNVRTMPGFSRFSLGQWRANRRSTIGNPVRWIEHSERVFELIPSENNWSHLIKQAHFVIQDLSQSLGYIGPSQFTGSGEIDLKRWSSDSQAEIRSWAQMNSVAPAIADGS